MSIYCLEDHHFQSQDFELFIFFFISIIIILLFNLNNYFYSYEIVVALSLRSIYHPAYCTSIASSWCDEDDEDDMATEVQTNFYHSQYYTMITTKSKIKIIPIHKISYELIEFMPCCFPSLWSLTLLLLLHCSLSNVSSAFPLHAVVVFILLLCLFILLFWVFFI